MRDALLDEPAPTQPMRRATARMLAATRLQWAAAAAGARLTPLTRPATVAPSLIADAGETGPRTRAFGQAPAPKVYRPGNSQAKGPHRIGLSGE
jgi:hypothetical protein